MQTYNGEELDRKIDAFLSKKLAKSHINRSTIQIEEESSSTRFSPRTVRFFRNGFSQVTTHLV